MTRTAPLRSTTTRAATLWIVFVAVHVWLSFANFTGPHTPLNDVSTVYRTWVLDGFEGRGWVGIDVAWVYPTVALVPMVLAAAAGFVHYSGTWLLLVAVLDAIALAALTRGGTATGRRYLAGWWWLAFLLALGPIALGRIDAVTAPLAILGLLLAASRPMIASAVLTVATWIKVWPFALVAALVVVSRRRVRVALAAAGTSIVIVLASLAAGGTGEGVTGFIGKQTGRGLQIEAPITTLWLWLEANGVAGVSTSFDRTILTYQVTGPGSGPAAALTTPIMALTILGILALAVVSMRRGASPVEVLAPLSLALTAAFIVMNKVGSPQYEVWLAAPVVLGLVTAGRRFAVPAALVGLIAALTQVIYPWNYDALVLAAKWMVLLITVRNAMLVALLVLAIVAVARAARPGARIDA